MDVGGVGSLMDMFKAGGGLLDSKGVADMTKLNEGVLLEDRIKDAVGARSDRELRDACMEFENVFLNILMRELRRTVPKSDFIPEGFGMEVFKSMLDEELMKAAAKSGGIGIAESMYRQLSPSASGLRDRLAAEGAEAAAADEGDGLGPTEAPEVNPFAEGEG
ncbi:MAG: rod-binding protein [Oscillospiraceae bacterium]|nr:rod-binding protein [Oscillospiraceae bacterium]